MITHVGGPCRSALKTFLGISNFDNANVNVGREAIVLASLAGPPYFPAHARAKVGGGREGKRRLGTPPVCITFLKCPLYF